MASAEPPLTVVRGRGQEKEFTKQDVANCWRRHKARLDALKVKSPVWVWLLPHLPRLGLRGKCKS
eukprot:3397320-Amphidinium_carterae.3